MLPFIYGRPVRSKEFLNRDSELQTLFGRLRNRESTAIVGGPRIGKTSLLLQLADERVRESYLGSKSQLLVVSLLNFHAIGSAYTPNSFWQDALEPLRNNIESKALEKIAQLVPDSDYSRRLLERLFHRMGQENYCLVLLLDEFESVLTHPNFQEPTFFAILRSLATITGGIAIVTASRLSVAEMNKRVRTLVDVGSPVFNNFIELRLRPFSDSAVTKLLDRASNSLDDDDKRFIRRVAGRHPYLLQAMTAAMIETTGDNRQARAAERFYERISFHFDDLWYTLDDRTRTTAVILSLVELGSRILGSKFSFSEIEDIESFGPELRVLAEQGMAEKAGAGWQFDFEHLLLWRGEKWTVGSQAFAWWIRDTVVAESRRVPTPTYEEWLRNKRYQLLLTGEQWERLITLLRKAPEWGMKGVGALADALFTELTQSQ